MTVLPSPYKSVAAATALLAALDAKPGGPRLGYRDGLGWLVWADGAGTVVDARDVEYSVASLTLAATYVRDTDLEETGWYADEADWTLIMAELATLCELGDGTTARAAVLGFVP
jgi:hypothetical protein